MKRIAASVFALFVSFLSSHVMAETPSCDGLTDAAQKSLDEAISTATAYGCCTDSIKQCLATNPECKSARYLFEDACKAAKDKSGNIAKAIENRRKAMDPAIPQSPIEVNPRHIWGNPESKTVLTVYLCGRCPYCSKHVPKLVEILEKEALKDKVALNLRYFPIKSHVKSTEAALAIEAAAQMDNAWPYLIKSYANFDNFSLNQIPVWVKDIGLDAEKHAEWMNDKETRNYIKESKKEGFKNGVTTTPTFFINGRRIYHEFNADTLVSLIRESLETQDNGNNSAGALP